MNKVLITGGNGYIGIKLAEYLRNNYTVITIDRIETDNEKQQHYCVDLLNKNELEKIIDKTEPDMIIHLAGIKKRLVDYNVFLESININFIGALNLFDIMQHYNKTKKIIVLGSAEEYGRTDCIITEETPTKPINAYSFSKQCLFNLCNYYLREYNLPILYLRPSVVYGPDQDETMFIPQMINTLIKNEEFKMTKGEQWRDFLYIDDLIDIISILIEKELSEHWVYNICSNKQYQIKEIAINIAEILDKRNLLNIGALPYRNGEVMNYNLSGNRILKDFAWKPKIDLSDGLNNIIDSKLKKVKEY